MIFYYRFPDLRRQINARIRFYPVIPSKCFSGLTGKEDLGQDHLRNAALKALEDNVSLPIVLERT
jgi:hypothetical protein